MAILLEKTEKAGTSLSEFLPGLRRALAIAGDTHSVEDVMQQIIRGEALLWYSDEALVVTEVMDTPQERLLRFWLATGKLSSVIELSEKACVWGRKIGCTRAIFAGRRGWARVLPKHGWHDAKLVHMERRL